MGIEKTEIRKGTLEQVGSKLDDMLEAAQKQAFAHEGANQALQQCATVIAKLVGVVDQEVDEGKYDLEVAKVARSFIARAQVTASEMARQQANAQLIAAGKLEAFRAAIGWVKMEFDKSTQQAEAQAAGDEWVGHPAQRPTGVRPGPSVAAQRRLELVPETTEAAAEKPSPGPAKQRGGRRKKDVARNA